MYSELINEIGRYEYWQDEYFHIYERKNGLHFNDSTLAIALTKIINRDGSVHRWSKSEVAAVFEKKEWAIGHGYNICDVTYIANMLYADYFGSSIVDEVDILKMARDYICDPDGYGEKAFCGWLNDLMFKAVVVDWATLC